MTYVPFVPLSFVLLLGGGSAFGESSPPLLANTHLYTELAHQCHSVDLATWKHTTKRVLARYKVPLDSLELCNNNTYPIFHVRFSYEPRVSDTDSFYLPFIAAMFVANSHFPMAFVDPSNQEIVTITNTRGAPREGLEDFKP